MTIRPLVLEDNPLVQRAITRLLCRHFVVQELHTAESVVEAIAVLDDVKGIDLIISDYNVEGSLTGANLYQWVRQHCPALNDRFLFHTSDEQAFEIPVPTVLKGSNWDLLVRLINKMFDHQTP